MSNLDLQPHQIALNGNHQEISISNPIEEFDDSNEELLNSLISAAIMPYQERINQLEEIQMQKDAQITALFYTVKKLDEIIKKIEAEQLKVKLAAPTTTTTTGRKAAITTHHAAPTSTAAPTTRSGMSRSNSQVSGLSLQSQNLSSGQSTTSIAGPSTASSQRKTLGNSNTAAATNASATSLADSRRSGHSLSRSAIYEPHQPISSRSDSKQHSITSAVKQPATRSTREPKDTNNSSTTLSSSTINSSTTTPANTAETRRAARTATNKTTTAAATTTTTNKGTTGAANTTTTTKAKGTTAASTTKSGATTTTDKVEQQPPVKVPAASAATAVLEATQSIPIPTAVNADHPIQPIQIQQQQQPSSYLQSVIISNEANISQAYLDSQNLLSGIQSNFASAEIPSQQIHTELSDHDNYTKTLLNTTLGDDSFLV